MHVSDVVGVAIARGQVEGLRALLTQGPLQSEWLWLPELHVLQPPNEDEDGEPLEYESDRGESLLRTWRGLRAGSR